MALNDKEGKTLELVRELSEVKGNSEPAAVRLAVEETLRLERRVRVKEKWMKIGEKNAALFGGTLNSQDIDELLYDEIGLPK